MYEAGEIALLPIPKKMRIKGDLKRIPVRIIERTQKLAHVEYLDDKFGPTGIHHKGGIACNKLQAGITRLYKINMMKTKLM